MAAWQLDLLFVPGSGSKFGLPDSPDNSGSDAIGTVKYWPDIGRSWSDFGLAWSKLRESLAEMLPENTSRYGQKGFGEKSSVLIEVNADDEMVTNLMMRVSLLPSFPPAGIDVGSHMEETVTKAFGIAKRISDELNLIPLWPDDHQPCDLSSAYLFQERARRTKAWSFADNYRNK